MEQKQKSPEAEVGKALSDIFGNVLTGLVLAFFLVGIGSVAYMVFRYPRTAEPGGFATNRGTIESLTPTTIYLDPEYSWSTAEIRITDRTIILDFGKEVISMSNLEEEDLIFVHGIGQKEYIEAVTITLLPPDDEDEPVVIRKNESTD